MIRAVRLILAACLGASLITTTVRPFENPRAAPSRVEGRPKPDTTATTVRPRPDITETSAGVRGVRLGPGPIERGTLRLHYVQKPIGYERYEVARDGDLLTMTSDFDFTDRG